MELNNFDIEFARDAYDFCHGVSWDEVEMQGYAARNDTIYEKVRDCALQYAKEKVGETEYLSAVMSIRKDQDKKKTYSLESPNPVLLKNKGINVYTLWRTYEERQLVLTYIFDDWKKNNYDVDQIVQEFGITRNFANTLIDDYINYYLRRDPVSYRKKMSRAIEAKRSKALEKLLEVEKFNEMDLIIKKSGFTASYLREYLHDFLVVYHKHDYDEYYKILDNNFKEYQQYIKECAESKNKKEYEKYINDVLPSASKLIEMFIESECDSIKEFIVKYKLDDNSKLTGQQMFDECLLLVKENNEELYKKYQQKMENKRNQNYAILLEKVKNVVGLFLSGIDDNGVIRSFDIIDYFQNCKLDLNTFCRIVRDMYSKKMISINDYKSIVKFMKSNEHADFSIYNSIDTIMDEKQEINCRKDKDGFPIPNTGEVVSDDLKNELINYLNDNNIPVNYKTYRALLNRYSMGLISFLQSKFVKY